MCELTSGKAKNCRKGFSGVLGFTLGELANIASITAANGVVSAMAMASGKKAWFFEVEQGTSNFKASGAGNRQAGTYVNTHTVMISNNDFDVATVNSGMEISETKGLFAVVHYKNGKKRLAGVSVDRTTAGGNGNVSLELSSGLMLDTDEHDSGTNPEDQSGEIWTMSAKENRKPLEISKAIADSLLIAVS